MYFIPRNNKFYSWAAHIKPMHRYILSGFLATILFVGWWFFLYSSIENIINIYQEQIKSLRIQNMNIFKEKKSVVQLERSVKDLRGTLDSYCADCNTLQKSQLTFLLKYLEQVGLHLQAYNVGSVEDKEWYICQNAQCMFIGTISQFLFLLNQLNTAQELVACKNITLNRMHDEDLFAISCDMQLYNVKKL